MGFELDRLMDRYGVRTPVIASYSGAINPNPYKSQLSPKVFEEAMAAYRADRAAYNEYVQEFNRRLRRTDLYEGPEWQAKIANPDYSGYKFEIPEPPAPAPAPAPTPAPPPPEMPGGASVPSQPSVMGGPSGSIPGTSVAAGPSTPASNVGVVATTPTTPVPAAPQPPVTATQPAPVVPLPPTSPRPPAQPRPPRPPRPPAQPRPRDNIVARPSQPAIAEQPAMLNLQLPTINDPGVMPLFQLENKYNREGLNFSHGGAVKTHFQDGGLNEVPPVSDVYPDIPMQRYGMQPAEQQAQPSPQAMLQGMLSQYLTPSTSNYGSEYAAARAAAQADAAEFQKMLKDAMTRESAGPSKAEMYFRLAAAFADPGKTGSFGEGLGRAAGVMAEHTKAEREARSAAQQQRQQLGLALQQAKMGASREDLASLRAGALEEEKSKRAVALEMLKEWAKQNDPLSAAGKQAKDEGLKPGTREYQKRVAEIGQVTTDRAMQQITASVAGMNMAQANLALAKAKEDRAQEQAERQKNLLTPQELKLKTETENTAAEIKSNFLNLKKALQLNPNTFDSSLIGKSQEMILAATKSDDPKLVNTRELKNLLSKISLGQLKDTFPGAISNDERKALMELQGIESVSIKERDRIIKNALAASESAYARHKKRLNEITQGLYRNISPEKEPE